MEQPTQESYEFATLRVHLRTPASLGQAGRGGFYPVLDSLLLHRLVRLLDLPPEEAMQHMPLARHDSAVWACGGGFDPLSKLRQASWPQGYPAFRRLVDREVFSLACESPDEVVSGVNRMFGQATLATSYTYLLHRDTLRLDFRFWGDARQVLRLMQIEPFLASGHSVGLGEIGQIDIESAPDDASWTWLFTGPDGRLTRPLPVDVANSLGLSGRRDYGAVCAPYWQSPKVARVVPPLVGLR